jgi:poly-beta-hydroxybutyrate-responsive repressor
MERKARRRWAPDAGEWKLEDHERFIREGPQKGFAEPRLLYLIKERPSHGYRLIEDIEKLPFPGPAPDSAAVYRALRRLEKEGLIRSRWETGEAGPPRRVYSITPLGEDRLAAWVEAFRERAELLRRFVSMCERTTRRKGYEGGRNERDSQRCGNG